LALSTGTLVFSAGLLLEKIEPSSIDKLLISASWVVLTVSILTGVISFSRIPMLIAAQKYDVNDKYMVIPGMIHQLTLLLGVLLLGVALIKLLY